MTNLALVYSISETIHLASDNWCKHNYSAENLKSISGAFLKTQKIGFKFEFVTGLSLAQVLIPN